MTALVLSPGELRLAAQSLGREADELRRLAAGARCTVAEPDTWSGVAAAAQQTWQLAWARLLSEVLNPLDDLSDLVASFAEQVEQGQHRIRSWIARKDQALRDLFDLERLLRTADEAVRAELERRAEQARQLVERARQEAADAQDWVRGRADTLAAIVADSWPARLVQDLVALDQVRRGVKGLGRAWQVALGSRELVRLAVQFAREQGVAARKMLVDSTRLAALVALRSPKAVSFAARLVHPATFVVLTGVGAVSDVLTGGGYEGWRGVTTRVFGGAALLALPALAVPFPPVVAAGGVVLAGYTAWTAGNLVYDNRVVLAKVGRFALRKTGEAAQEIEERLHIVERVGTGVERVEQLGRDAQRGWGVGWDWAKEHLNPLPDPDDAPGLRVPIPIRLPFPSGPTVPIWVSESDVKEWLPWLPDPRDLGPWLPSWPPDLRWPGIPDPFDLPGPPDLPRVPVLP